MCIAENQQRKGRIQIYLMMKKMDREAPFLLILEISHGDEVLFL